MYTKKAVEHIWTEQDEREHNNCALEWWCLEGFFTNIKDDKKFCFKSDLTEWYTSKPKGEGSLSKMTFFDLSSNKHYRYNKRDNKKRLKSEKNCFNICFDKSYIKGSYPDFEIFFVDKKNNIEILINFHAESNPHWVTQDITDGWLPLGFGTYRYGFIPKGKISGYTIMNNKKIKIEGFGYFEHVWGDFTYHRILENIKQIKKTFKIYTSLIGTWKKNYKIKIPNKIKLLSENNPLGYDWFWAVLNNGWSIFYGNIMMWLMQGPAAGPLILTKDGMNYEEFYKIDFKYNKVKHAKDYDFIYPTELEIRAVKDKKELFLKCKTDIKPVEYVSRFSDSKIWLGLAICEIPGSITGYYKENNKKINLSGFCKIEPQRQMSVFGHNQLDIDIIKPPKGIGFNIDFFSNFFKKHIFLKFVLNPRPKLKFKIKKI